MSNRVHAPRPHVIPTHDTTEQLPCRARCPGCSSRRTRPRQRWSRLQTEGDSAGGSEEGGGEEGGEVQGGLVGGEGGASCPPTDPGTWTRQVQTNDILDQKPVLSSNTMSSSSSPVLCFRYPSGMFHDRINRFTPNDRSYFFILSALPKAPD